MPRMNGVAAEPLSALVGKLFINSKYDLRRRRRLLLLIRATSF